jgi:DNA repair photolyase
MDPVWHQFPIQWVMGILPPKQPPRDRGAASNAEGRFERLSREPFDDGWDGFEVEAPAIRTTVTPEPVRTVITRNDSPDVPFDQALNPYKGCEHGCVYCFARPSHAYLGLSPGLDFESRIFSKPQAPARLRTELSRPSYRCEVLAIGANTDPYQPAERKLQITRRVLEVLAELEHPVSVVTKSNLILRDLDILAPMAAKQLASVFVSITTLDPVLARRLEPRAPSPERRLSAVRQLSEAGVPVGVLASPMIPALNDAELERILETSRASGARWARYLLVRLPHELKDLFAEWLDAEYPERATHVMNLIRETRRGRLNDPRFGTRMRGEGRYAELLERRFDVACRRWGFDQRPFELDVSRFAERARRGGQMELFDVCGTPRSAPDNP